MSDVGASWHFFACLIAIADGDEPRPSINIETTCGKTNWFTGPLSLNVEIEKLTKLWETCMRPICRVPETKAQPGPVAFARGICALLKDHPCYRILSQMLSVLLFVCPLTPVASQTIDEIKLGVLVHGLLNDPRQERGYDINAEADFSALEWFTDSGDPQWRRALLGPRPVVGFSANTSGYTSRIYLGLNWRETLWKSLAKQDDAVYADFTAGGTVHNGELDDQDPRANALGSRVLFHLAGEIGYAFDPHYSVTGYFEHASNGGLARWNRSLNEAGLRLGYRF